MNKAICIIAVATVLISACTYSVKDEEAKQVGERTKSPIKTSNLDIELENEDTLKHEALVLGIMCSANKYNLDMAEDLRTSLSDIDKNGLLSDPKGADVRVVMSSTKSSLKCIATGVISAKCMAKVEVVGETIAKNGEAKSFAFSKSSIRPAIASVSAPLTTCGGGASSLAEASAEVVDEIIELVKLYDN